MGIYRMDMYSQIVIENYCSTHKTQKASFLRKMLKCAEHMDIPDDAEMLRLAKYVERERDDELREGAEGLGRVSVLVMNRYNI